MRKNIDMVNGSLFKSIWLYAIPVIMSGVLQLLFNAADLVVVGQYCGSVSVAAVGATGALINLIVNLFIGLSVGVGVTVATALGAGNREQVSQTVHTAVPMALIGGVALMGIGTVLTYPMLRWMATPADVIDLSAIYMKIYFVGMPAGLVYNYGSAILRSDGDTKRPLYYLTAAGVLNVGLNIFFVVSFHMDVAGVALATALSQTVSAALVVRALVKNQGACHLELREMHIYKKPLLRICRIGFPAGMQGAMFSVSNVIIQSSINSFGSVVVAGNSAGANIEGFTFISMNAFNQTGMNFIGQNYGAGKTERLRRIRRYCLLDVILVGLVMGVGSYLFARELLGIYITDSPAAIDYGVIRMKWICLPYALNGLHDVMTGILRGYGYSLAPMVVTVLCICVLRIVYIYTLFRIPRFHTLDMLYATYPISWIITFAALMLCYVLLTRKQRKQI